MEQGFLVNTLRYEMSHYPVKSWFAKDLWCHNPDISPLITSHNGTRMELCLLTRRLPFHITIIIVLVALAALVL